MLRPLLGIGALSLFLSWPLPAAAQNAPKNPAPAASTTIDANLLYPGQYAGKLLSTPLAGGSFNLEVEYKHLALKPGARLPNQNTGAMAQLQRDVQRIAQLQGQLQSSRNPQQAAQHMQQLQQAMMQAQQHQMQAQQQQQANLAQMFQVVTEKKTVEFHVGDELAVRLLHLPVDYDDKGKLRQPPAPGTEEYKKLKGNPKLPGFEAKAEDLKTGSLVLVVQVRPKPPAPVKSDSKEGDKETKETKEAKEAAAKEAKEMAANSPKVVVSMIVILGEDPNSTSMADGNKKPKK